MQRFAYTYCFMVLFGLPGLGWAGSMSLPTTWTSGSGTSLVSEKKKCPKITHCTTFPSIPKVDQRLWDVSLGNLWAAFVPLWEYLEMLRMHDLKPTFFSVVPDPEGNRAVE